MQNDMSYTVKVMAADGSVKSYTKNIKKTVDVDGGPKERYNVIWKPDSAQLTTGLPPEAIAREIATKMARIYGATAVMTQMSFGMVDVMKDWAG